MPPARILLALAALLIAPSASAVTLTSANFSLTAAFPFPPVSDNFSATTFPLSTSLHAENGDTVLDGNYSASGAGVSIGLNHTVAAGTIISYANNSVDFLATSAVDYAITGTFSSTDPAPPSVIGFTLVLHDVTLGTDVFRNEQQSSATPNESFTVGLEEGDTTNVLIGSTAGTLTPGHEYAFVLDLYFHNTSSSSLARSAVGSFNLTFVPEPSLPLLLASASALLAAASRRGR